LIEDASRGVNLQPEDVANAIQQMRAADIRILTSADVLGC